MAVQLEDWIPSYPKQDDPNIQKLFTEKAEFAELQGQVREDPPKRGQGYKHQKLFLRMMRAFDRVLNIAETGTGKSCSFVHLAEWYKHHRREIRQVYVFERGPTTKEDFKNQIVCKCTDGEYETAMVRRARGATRKGNITREVGKWYTVTTYRTFANEVTERIISREGLTEEQIDEAIADAYSGSLFLLDEAHNIRNDGIHKANELEQVYNVLWRVFHKVKRSKVVVSTATPMINSVDEIARMANLILPEDQQMPLDWDYTKVTLAQMEPYFRGRVTFVRNLDTGAIPVYQGSPLPDVPAAYHEIKVPDPKWVAPKPQEVDIKVPPTPQKGAPGPRPPRRVRALKQPEPPMVTKRIRSQVVVYPTQMQGIQLQTYNRLEGEVSLEDAEIEEEKGSQFHQAKRQAACFVFPDGSIGGTFPRERKVGEAAGGINHWVTSEAKDQYTATREFKAILADPEQLAQCSSKYAEILRIEKEEKGCSFIYTGDFVSGGGAVVLSLCFAANGFERFEASSSVFSEPQEGEEDGACISSTGNRHIRSDFKKMPRYALLTGETSDSKFTTMMELFNSEENANGEYIKVLIGSIVARDGINLYNVVRGHLVTAGWHPSGIHQALSRFLRATSHEYLLNLRRKEAKDRGEDPALVTVEVKIYKHVAVDAQLQSIDIQLYVRLAEWKDLHIRRMMRILKQCAIDCQINRRRNIRLRPILPVLGGPRAAGEIKALPSPQAHFDVDFSPACDYDLCDYPCATAHHFPTKDELDYSTYDILYADDAVAACVDDLSELLQDRGSLSFTDLKELLVETGEYREKIVYMAIDKMLLEKKQLLDRFGYTCYVQTDGLNVFTQREFPTAEISAAGSELASYSDQIIGVDVAPFSKVLDERQAGSQAATIIQMQDIKDPTRGEGLIIFNQILKQLSLDSRVKLLEYAITERVAGRVTPINTAIVNRFEAFTYETFEPWQDIKETAAKSAERGRGQGRKAGAGSKVKAHIEFKGEPPEGSINENTGRPVDRVYIHTLYSAKPKLTAYSVTSDFTNIGGRIRIYNPAEPILGWRDANPYEVPAYSNIIRLDLERRMEPYEREPIYGSILQDGKFRIHIKEEGVEGDKRGRYRGEACKTLSKPKLIEIMYREGLPLPGEEKARFGVIEPPPPKTSLPSGREKLIEYLIGKEYTKDRSVLEQYYDYTLKYVAQWYASGANRDYICEEIKRRFQATGRLLVV